MPFWDIGEVLELRVPPCRLIRIILGDEVEALYDVWYERWDYSRRRRANYRRDYSADLRAGSRRVRCDELSEKERQVHRPDLPLRMCRVTAAVPLLRGDCDLETFSASLSEVGVRPDELGVLDAPRVELMVIGKTDSNILRKMVDSRNGRWFSGSEILWHASRLPRPDRHDGIGVYRMGFRPGAPVYYVGGYYDLGGCLARHEQSGGVIS